MKILFSNLVLKSKKINIMIIFLIFIIIFPISIFSQSNALTIGMGMCFSLGYGNGFYYSTVFGKDFDESVFYGIGIDFGMSSVSSENSTDSLTLIYFPLYATLRVRIPVSLPFSIFFAGGMGYDFMFNIVAPLDTATVEGNKTFFYGSFYWQLKIGLGMMLGSRSDGQVEIVFSSPSFNLISNNLLSENIDNYEVAQKINMTVIAIIFSIRFFQM